jgi:hypothetical protein
MYIFENNFRHILIPVTSIINFTIMLIMQIMYKVKRSRDSSVGIATGHGLDGRGVWVRVPVGSRIFSSPRRPDRLWGPPNILSNGYRDSFLGGKAAGAWSWPLTFG